MTLASIPSPSISTFEIGPLTIHLYALCILAGIIAAVAITTARWKKVGGDFDQILDIAIVSVLAGIVGARVYHIVTTPERFFGPDGDPMEMIRIWNGGLGIWGGILFGALAAWGWCRHKHYPMALLADAVAPALLVAQAIGRLGNWFNQELYGGQTTLPWGLQIRRIRCAVPPDVPLRADLEPDRSGPHHLDRTQGGGHAQGRLAADDLRDVVYRRTHLDRGAAHRLRPYVPRRADQRVGVHRGVHLRRHRIRRRAAGAPPPSRCGSAWPRSPHPNRPNRANRANRPGIRRQARRPTHPNRPNRSRPRRPNRANRRRKRNIRTMLHDTRLNSVITSQKKDRVGTMSIQIAPSILSADFCNLERDLKASPPTPISFTSM